MSKKVKIDRAMAEELEELELQFEYDVDTAINDDNVAQMRSLKRSHPTRDFNRIAFESIDYSCEAGNVNMVQLFLKWNSEADRKFLNDKIPRCIKVACQYKQNDILKLLLKNASFKFDDINDGFDVACIAGNEIVIKTLLEWRGSPGEFINLGDKMDLLNEAASDGLGYIVKNALEWKNPIDKSVIDPTTMLISAVPYMKTVAVPYTRTAIMRSILFDDRLNRVRNKFASFEEYVNFLRQNNIHPTVIDEVVQKEHQARQDVIHLRSVATKTRTKTGTLTQLPEDIERLIKASLIKGGKKAALVHKPRSKPIPKKTSSK